MADDLETEDKKLEDMFDFKASNISPLGSYSLTLKKESRLSKIDDLIKFINLTNAITRSEVLFDRNIGKDCQDTRLYQCLIQKLCAHFPTITFYTIDNDLQLTCCSKYETDRAILLYISERKLYVISSLKTSRTIYQPAGILSQTCLSLSLTKAQIDKMIHTQRNSTEYLSNSRHISNPRNNTPADVPKNKSTFRSRFRRQFSKAKHNWSIVKHRISDKIGRWKRSWKEKLRKYNIPSNHFENIKATTNKRVARQVLSQGTVISVQSGPESLMPQHKVSVKPGPRTPESLMPQHKVSVQPGHFGPRPPQHFMPPQKKNVISVKPGFRGPRTPDAAK